MNLTGKRILVTGCGGGIGSAISRDIIEHGGELIATDRADAGAAVARQLNAACFPLDVTDETNWLQLVDQLRSRYGTLDGLVNNAGVILMKPLLETTLADYRRINAINNDGVFLGMRTLAPLLAKSSAAHGTSIVNFSSIYGLGGQPGFAAYCAAKGAVRLVTKAAALEFAQNGLKIRVNSVHPGPIDTPLARAPLQALVSAGVLESVDAGMKSVAASYPGGRVGKPDDVAGVVTFLLSDAARFINGVELPVDYGFTAKAQ